MLSNAALLREPRITVVGCGGTGGFVADGLARLLLALNRPDARVLLQDHDRVEERNLLRQNFYRSELGLFKAAALADRLCRQYERPISYRIEPFGRNHNLEPSQADLFIGCVDNAPARAELATAVKPPGWWIDAGNGEDFGQVLVGNADAGAMRNAFDDQTGICYALPLPTLQVPELALTPALAQDDPNCAVAVQQGDQSPVVNQMMASVVLEVVRRLLLGSCPWMRVDVDLRAMTMRPVDASPEAAARAAGLKPTQLIRKGGRDGRV